MRTVKITVGSTPTLVVTAPVFQTDSRPRIVLQILGPNSIFVGGADVAASGVTQGWKLNINGAANFANFGSGEAIWAVCSPGETSDVVVLLEGPFG